MIVVRYVYLRKRDKKICHSSLVFFEIDKACRFIHSLVHDKTGTRWYDGYYTDDPEENEEMNRRIY